MEKMEKEKENPKLTSVVSTQLSCNAVISR